MNRFTGMKKVTDSGKAGYRFYYKWYYSNHNGGV